MLRGTIEEVTRTHIAGWIHTDTADLRNATVLAFHGKECVGAGSVGLFRQDLADAGLGEGFCGFRLPLDPRRDFDPASLYVKLEGSDFLLPVSSPAAQAPNDAGQSLRDALATLKWMLQRGWISAEEFEVLSDMHVLGVRELAVLDGGGGVDAAAAEFEAYVQLLLRRPTTVHRRETEAGQVGPAEDQATPAGTKVLGLWAHSPVTFEVVEGSHRLSAAARRTPDWKMAIEHVAQPTALLLLHAGCVFRAEPVKAIAQRVIVFGNA